ncbi:MAG: RNA polymerase sigma factor [Gallionellaceae bacterium]|nr:RNA polymerase sigma factor [Gallionellaceae bacterium]MDD5366159.1 RNA polymerase sigma factor [Gallionellaceae bacterium]
MNKLVYLFSAGLRGRLTAMRPRLYRLAYAWCHDGHLADDLTQEALARAIDRAGQIKDEAAFEGWLFAILNNCWRDYLRRCKDCVDIEDIDEAVFAHDATPERLYASRQASNRVRIAIAHLPVGQRQVLTLVDIEECSYAEVATVLDIPVGTVMSRLSRARQTLKAQLIEDAPARVVQLTRRSR